MKALIFFLGAYLMVFSGKAQQAFQHDQMKVQVPSGKKPWTAKRINDKPGQFQFAIVTDRTGGHRPGIFEDGVEKLNLLQPEFVMSVGDLIEGYTTDTMEINRQWDEFDGFVEKLDMPFFYVPGNHDITNPVMEKIWEKRLGLKNYSFVYKDVLFIAANSEDQARGAGRGSISAPQLEWIRKTLSDHANVRWTFLFMHQPLWAQETDPVKWFEVEKLLSNRKHTVFVGHAHNYLKYERNQSNYYVLATTGGASPMRGPQFGEFDHFVWITMTERGPVMANLQLSGIFDDAVRTEARAAFADKVWSSDIIRIEPLYVDGQTFKKDSLKIRLTNPFDVPMKVTLENAFSWDLKTDLPRPEISLAPNSVSFVSMEMEARNSKPLADMQSVKLRAAVALQDGKGNDNYFIPFEYNVAPLSRHELHRVVKPVSVDGKLNEWKNLPYRIDTKEGAQFGIAYDDKFVYMAVQVNDKDVRAQANEVTFNQDFVGFVLNGLPLAKSAADLGHEWFANSLYFIVSPADKSGKNSVWDLGEVDKIVTWKCVKNDKGYALELAAPISNLQQLQGNAWRNVRINVVVQDQDAGVDNPERKTWQPNWRDSDNVVGSGMFFRMEPLTGAAE